MMFPVGVLVGILHVVKVQSVEMRIGCLNILGYSSLKIDLICWTAGQRFMYKGNLEVEKLFNDSSEWFSPGNTRQRPYPALSLR